MDNKWLEKPYTIFGSDILRTCHVKCLFYHSILLFEPPLGHVSYKVRIRPNWTVTHQTSTQDSTSDKSQGGVGWCLDPPPPLLIRACNFLYKCIYKSWVTTTMWNNVMCYFKISCCTTCWNKPFKSLKHYKFTTVLAENFASIKFRDFVVKSSVFIFASTNFRESLNTQDVNTGDITIQRCADRRQSDYCIPDWKNHLNSSSI